MAETMKKYLDYEGLEHLIDTRIKNVSVAEPNSLDGAVPFPQEGGTSVGYTLMLKHSNIPFMLMDNAPANCENGDIFVRSYSALYGEPLSILGFSCFDADNNKIKTALLDFNEFDESDSGLVATRLYVDSKTWKASDITSGTFDARRIPNLNASKITEGKFSASRIPKLDADMIGSGTLWKDRIPDLDANKITTGTFDIKRIPDLDADKITTGTLNADRIPGLSVDKITRGTFDSVRIPDLDADKITTGTFDIKRIPDLDADKITMGTISPFRIPDLDAEKITTGTLPVERGGTGKNFSPLMIVDLAKTSAASIFGASPSPGVKGILPEAHGGTGVSSLTDLIQFSYNSSTKTLNITVDESLM